jgi:hypothetical protein
VGVGLQKHSIGISNVPELQMIVFSVDDFLLGAEVDHIISIVKDSENTNVIKEIEMSEDGDDNISVINLSEYLSSDNGYNRGSNKSSATLILDLSSEVKILRVDSIHGVVSFSIDQIEPLPEFLAGKLKNDCIWGIAKMGYSLVILLDLYKYLERLK